MYSYFNYPSSQMSLIRVTGIEGARAYQMPANSVVALFDNNDDIMYIKSTDGAGFPTIRTFSFTEVVQNVSNNSFVTREEFESFRNEVREYGKQSVSKSRKQSSGSSEANNEQ